MSRCIGFICLLLICKTRWDRPPAEDEFKASAAMQEMVLSFLTRMAFLLGEAHKEPDYRVQARFCPLGHALYDLCLHHPGT